MPPFELPALSPADARYLAGCLLLGERVPCTDIHAVAGAVAEACKSVPSAIRNTVDWMARFAESPWSPDRVSEIPSIRDLEEDDRAEPGTLEEHISLFGPEDLVQPEPDSPPALGSASDHLANRGFATLFPFSLDAVADESALVRHRLTGEPLNDPENRSIVAGPLAERGTGDPLDPANRSFDWLEATLSAPHRKVVMDVRTALARGVQSGAPHHIVLAGPAGSGKSHTLAVLAKGFAKGLGLSGRPRKIIYLTGSDQVAESPFDLLLACMQAENSANERLRARLDAAAPENRFGELMTAFRERFGNQCTVVALEGLGTLLRNWNKTALESLRLFLDMHPSVILLGTTGSERLDTGRFHGWLRERFRSCVMPALAAESSRDLLCSLATARGDRGLAAALREPQRTGVVQTIHTLSGGNCRVLASLDRCLSVKGLSALGEPVLQMTRGDLAPAYERRIGDRPTQQYKILQALAEHQGRAVNVTELARYMFLTPQAVSRQLQELFRAGFLVRTQVGREICYELSDPLIRFVLDFKHGRDTALPLLVRVTRRWCEIDRLGRSEDRGFPFVEAFRFESLVDVTFAMGASDDSPAAVVALVPDAGQQVEKRCERIASRQLSLGSPELRNSEMERQICALGEETETGFAMIFRAGGLFAQDRN
ncbi:MAG: MarR family transcriptional regulator, partial [Candidatus Hydrogenedentes bacterium]|nr:MarR family transcriptional regulator [Candidatus Hydrogenedentota bacterium]